MSPVRADRPAGARTCRRAARPREVVAADGVEVARHLVRAGALLEGEVPAGVADDVDERVELDRPAGVGIGTQQRRVDERRRHEPAEDRLAGALLGLHPAVLHPAVPVAGAGHRRARRRAACRRPPSGTCSCRAAGTSGSGRCAGSRPMRSEGRSPSTVSVATEISRCTGRSGRRGTDSCADRRARVRGTSPRQYSARDVEIGTPAPTRIDRPPRPARDPEPGVTP